MTNGQWQIDGKLQDFLPLEDSNYNDLPTDEMQ
jgi:hypothetical protein